MSKFREYFDSKMSLKESTPDKSDEDLKKIYNSDDEEISDICKKAKKEANDEDEFVKLVKDYRKEKQGKNRNEK